MCEGGGGGQAWVIQGGKGLYIGWAAGQLCVYQGGGCSTGPWHMTPMTLRAHVALHCVHSSAPKCPHAYCPCTPHASHLGHRRPQHLLAAVRATHPASCRHHRRQPCCCLQPAHPCLRPVLLRRRRRGRRCCFGSLLVLLDEAVQWLQDPVAVPHPPQQLAGWALDISVMEGLVVAQGRPHLQVLQEHLEGQQGTPCYLKVPTPGAIQHGLKGRRRTRSAGAGVLGAGCISEYVYVC